MPVGLELRRVSVSVGCANLPIVEAAYPIGPVGWSKLVADTVPRHGPIDILVNNAGIAVAGDAAADVSEEVWDRILTVNAKGVWLGMRAVLPAMIARQAGKIVNVASTAAHIGLRAHPCGKLSTW